MQIYDTLTKQKRELKTKKIGMYVCGPTVYDEPHIGHARSAYVFDVVVRYLRYRGFNVRFVRNITDVDDKIIDRARQMEGSGDLVHKVREVSQKYIRRYHEDMDRLGLERPDKEPKATEMIPEMIKLIKALIERGFAYESSGNVYFEVRKFSNYGSLSGQGIDEMEKSARLEIDKNKRDPLDFALWKASKSDEPFWPSPWGNGRPGWHIECSAMSTRYLGKNFIIHGGGLDLMFPHHENEIAQTEAAGKEAPRYWMHNGLLTINGQKMSKSLGNFISIGEFLKRHGSAWPLKVLFLSSHYRHYVDYTEEKINQVKEMRTRIMEFLRKADKKVSDFLKAKWQDYSEEEYYKEFLSAMDDDFNTPMALGVIFNCISAGNKILERIELSKDEKIKLCKAIGFIRGVSKDIFILNLDYGARDRGEASRINAMLAEREEARKNKDFKKADEIREALLKQGIVVEDTKEGPVWLKNY